MWHDFSIALRSLGKARTFTLAAVSVIALCVGANTAIFSIVNSVLWKPLHYKEPASLVSIQEALAPIGSNWGFSTPDYLAVAGQAKSFESIGAYTGKNWEVSGIDRSERVEGQRVTASLFTVLGVAPEFGRVFTSQEDEQGQKLAVLTHRYWRHALGGNDGVIGRTIYLDRQPYTVVGVMPESFVFPLRKAGVNGIPADIYIPMTFTPFERTGFGYMFNKSAIARLRPGVTPKLALAEVNGILKRFEKQYPADYQAAKGFALGATLVRYRDAVTGSLQTGLLMLLGAVGLVLLIGCANVANLLLARSVERRREFAVRLALGATRRDIVRQTVAENLTLSLLSGVLGLMLAQWLAPLLVRISPVEIPRVDEAGIDFTAILFTFAICSVVPVLFGLAPALTMSRVEISGTVRETGRSAMRSRAHRRWMSLAVVSQYAFTLVLLVGAGLLMRSFLRLRQVDPGFRTERVLSMGVKLPASSYKTGNEILGFWSRLMEAARSLPGVRMVGAISDLPLQPSDEWGLAIEGKSPEGGVPRSTLVSWVSGDAMSALGMKLVAGRFLSGRDAAGMPRVVVINEAMARQAWPGENPIGKRLGLGGKPDSEDGWVTVAGVVQDVRQGLKNTNTKPQAFQTLAQGNASMMKTSGNFAIRDMYLIVEGKQDAPFLSQALGRLVKAQDPALPVSAVETLDEYVSASVNPQRFDTFLVGGFALLAAVLALVGIGGVLSYAVAQRTNEIGVRMALGSQRAGIVQLVVYDGLKLAVAGILAGLVGAIAISGLIRSLLYQTSTHDPLTFLIVPLLLLIPSVGASLIPAWRATRIDPVTALRAE